MITNRQKQIFKLTLTEFIQKARPVSSAMLAKKYHLPWSTATIRQELNALEEEGSLTHPHTSSGRVPTDQGYRFFVDSIMDEESLSPKEQSFLHKELLGGKDQHHSLARTSAKLLAFFSQNMAVSGIADVDELHEAGIPFLLRCPEFAGEEQILEVLAIGDYLEENLGKIVSELPEHPVIYIGKENPFVKTNSCSMILASYYLFSKEKALIAIVGPKRMHYPRNLSLIKYFVKILGSALIILFIINYV